MRESEHHVPALPPTRPRRGRSMFERLRQTRTRAGAPARGAERSDDAAPATASAEDGGYDFLDSREDSARAPVAARARAAAAAVRGAVQQDPADALDTHAAEPAELTPEHAALAIFNGSEHPRRIAGVARSLGAPAVSVRSAEHARSVVRIVVAWELCWYRYEVDLDELDAEARVSAQGTELEELGADERKPNAVATADGRLAPAEA